PDAVAHDADPDEPRHEKVDVPRSRLPRDAILDRDRILPARRSLNGAIGERPRGPCLTVRVVVEKDDGAGFAGGGERYVAVAQGEPGLVFRQLPNVESLLCS